MKNIRIELPDTPAMRNLLSTLAVHVSDDHLPFWEEMAAGDDIPEGATRADMVAASEEFVDVVDSLFSGAA